MGFIATVDAASKGAVPLTQVKWRFLGYQVGFSSPVTDGKVVYQVDNGAMLLAFDANTGQKLWEHKLGTIQKASPVLADGKLYVGTETGKFFILRPKPGGVDVLSENQLGTEEDPEQVLSSASVSRGRVFFATSGAVYAIGKKSTAPYKPAIVTAMKANPAGTPAYVQVTPTDFIAKPGQKVQFHIRLFDDKGQFIREEKQATWNTGGFAGTIDATNAWTIPADAKAQGGEIKATVGSLTGMARARVIPPLPWTVDAAALPVNSPPPAWVNAATKYAVKETDGKKYLTKIAQIQHTFYLRARTFMGPSDLSNYTIEADVRSPIRRRQQGDIGVVAQGFQLLLFGSHQKLDIQSWQPEVERIASVPFEWQPDTWYHLKLRVENLPDGSVRAQGKAWPTGTPEPGKWTVERVDPIGPRSGSPGLFGSAPFEMLFDDVKVYANSASK
ncbi:MAG: PQQ-binding-like beta-propeller repeat protein [Acidobacteria bacterium]|nr:PQQ-binding-like beta-propeller repeat protein [Acidobacteriota bacterium]